MTALAWLAIPVVALLLAVLWVMWAGRERRRADTHESVEEHERFKRAFDAKRLGPHGRDAASRDTPS
jgi:cytochrome c-type biogenesis protein CcmH/NrfF